MRESVFIFFSDGKPNSQAIASLGMRETTDSSWIWVIFSLAGNGLFFLFSLKVSLQRAREARKNE